MIEFVKCILISIMFCVGSIVFGMFFEYGRQIAGGK